MIHQNVSKSIRISTYVRTLTNRKEQLVFEVQVANTKVFRKRWWQFVAMANGQTMFDTFFTCDEDDDDQEDHLGKKGDMSLTKMGARIEGMEGQKGHEFGS